jgi:acid phosphatase (class B)
MRPSLRIAFAVSLTLFAAGCASTRQPQPQGAVTPAAPAAARAMSIEDYIATELSGPAQAVGFDVDDTTYFSSPGFYWGLIEFGPGALRDPATISDPREREVSEKFWKRMNTELDRYDILKDSARKLIAAHRARGDTIIFITGRPDLRDGRDGLAAKITKDLGLESPQIHYTASADKSAAMRESHIQIYYGDSRPDMEAAAKAGIRAVAVGRSLQSISHGPSAESGPCQIILRGSAD